MYLRISHISLALLLAGCGGDSGDTSSTALPSYSLSGQVNVQNVALDAKVCLDTNQNFSCDASEASTQADRQGHFTLTASSTDLYRFPIVAEVSTGVASVTIGADVASMSALISPALGKTKDNAINGISTIFAGVMMAGHTPSQTNTLLSEQLALLGITVKGDLSENFNHSGLAILDANVIALIKSTRASDRISMLSMLGQTMATSTPLITQEIVSNDKIVEYIKLLLSMVSSERPLQDTGIVQFYSDNGLLDSANVDYPGQDAEYGLDITAKQVHTGNGFTLLKLDAQGKALADDATQWSCVKDAHSGLIWEVKSADPRSLQYKERLFALEIPQRFTPFAKDLALADCASTQDGVCSTQDYLNKLNQQQLCGLTTWRLPTGHEQYMLIDFGDTGNAALGFNRHYFPNQAISLEWQDGHTWTSELAYRNTSPIQQPGVQQYVYTALYGTNKGERSVIEVNSHNVDPDSDPSYILPIRVVATVETNQ